MAITVSAGCVILELGEGKHMKRNRSIRQQVQRLLFLCSVVSLLLLGGIALLGMMGARENSRQNGYEMGEEAALTVSTTLRKEAEERMQLLASERAAQIGLELQRIADRTELMRSEISWIMEHTGDYPLRSISEPRRENAGHNPPLVYHRREGKFSYMDVKRNFVLGGMDELTFQQQEIMLERGDKLFLYTDGVIEALSEDEELYGEERLEKCLNGMDVEHTDLSGILNTVQKSLAAHVGEAEQSDDITMMVLDYQGKQTGEV